MHLIFIYRSDLPSAIHSIVQIVGEKDLNVRDVIRILYGRESNKFSRNQFPALKTIWGRFVSVPHEKLVKIVQRRLKLWHSGEGSFEAVSAIGDNEESCNSDLMLPNSASFS